MCKGVKKPIIIYSDKVKESLSTESYPYKCLEIMKCVLNFVLLEYKNSIYSYYFNEEYELLNNDIKLIIDNEIANKIAHNIDEDEMVIAYD